MNTPALEVKSVDKHFGALHVAQNISLTLNPGDRHALIGPNGAGKTTFVNLITGAITPDGGTIALSGVDVTGHSQSQRSQKGLARTYQINQLFRELTVLENVCMAVAEHLGVASSLFRPLGKHPDVIDQALALLERFDLLDVAQSTIQSLAYGRQRLVEIVIALGQQPKVLLLDEPAAGVASAESDLILSAVDALPKEVAVLIIEHDMDVVFRFAREISVLVSGAILVSGSPDQIAADPKVQQVYLGQGTMS